MSGYSSSFPSPSPARSSAPEVKQTIEGLAIQVTSLPNNRKRNLFVKILKEEFLRELHFLSDVIAGRATRKKDFTTQLVAQLNKVVALADPTGIAAEVVSSLGEVAVFAANRDRDKRMGTVADLADQLDLPRLEVLLDVVAQEALRRYEDFIINRLSDDPIKGVVPFARVGARRMLEYLSRSPRQESESLIRESVLLAGLVEGRSGKWVEGFSNTELELKQTEKNRLLGSEKPRKIEAEVVYARSGLRHFEITGAEPVDKLYLRNTAKHQDLSAWERVKKSITDKNAEAFYNFGYVQYRKTKGYERDPKAGYVLMPLPVIQGRYEFKEVGREAMSEELKAELHSSSRSLVVVDRATIEQFIKHYKTFWAIDPIHKSKGLIDYVRTKFRCSNVERVICREDLSGLSLEGLNLSHLDLSGATLSGSLEETNFNHCYLIGTTLKDISSLKGASFQESRCDYLQAVDVDFANADLTQATFSYANLAGANLQSCKTLGALWLKTDLKGAQTQHLFEKKYEDLQEALSSQLKNAQEEIQKRSDQLQKDYQDVQLAQAALLKKVNNLEKNITEEDMQTQQDLLRLAQQQIQEAQARIVFEVHCKQEINVLTAKIEEANKNAASAKENSGIGELLTQLRKQLEETQQELQQLRPVKEIPADVLIITTGPSEKQQRVAAEVSLLLHHVARGEQAAAEAMLKKDHSLLLGSESVTDLSKRTFTNITAFQYALWAMDWRMWKMLLRYMPNKEIALEQYEALERNGTLYGKHFSLTPLIEALNKYVKSYEHWSADQCRAHWQGLVGGCQLLLPAHVAQEYCHPRQKFDPCPEFKEEKRSESLITKEGEWYNSTWNGGKLGEKFAYARGGLSKSEALKGYTLANALHLMRYEKMDSVALQSLWRMCQLQQEKLKDELYKHVSSTSQAVFQQSLEQEKKRAAEEVDKVRADAAKKEAALKKEIEQLKKEKAAPQALLVESKQLFSPGQILAPGGGAVGFWKPVTGVNAAEISQYSAEVSLLLHHVARGEQAAAEAMLKKDHSLLLGSESVTDLSKRTFTNITAFQYALWAMDWRMWEMFLEYLPAEVAGWQLQELENKETGHGGHFDLMPLIKALNIYVESYSTWDGKQCMEHWCGQIGGLQSLLPVHVVQEYCHPSRSFGVGLNFKEKARSESTATDVGKWYESEYNGGRLGEKFGYVRGDGGQVLGVNGSHGQLVYLFKIEKRSKLDAEALQSLWEARQQQLLILKNILISKSAFSLGKKE